MKIKYLLIIFTILLLPIYVKADHIYSLNMDVYVSEDGNAEVIEKWDVKADSGTEWYKQYLELENTSISDFYVYMDNKLLTKKNIWNVKETLEEKNGYYGINNITNPSTGIELCFGKGDMNRHIFTLKYKINKLVYNTADKQIIYFTMFPRVVADSFIVNVTSYYKFPDTLDVWGYGYDGYAYVKDGKIIMTNKKSLQEEYVVLLASFPENTFKTENKSSKFANMESVLAMANEGAKKYNDNADSLKRAKLTIIYMILILIGTPISIYLLIILISFIYGKIKAKQEKTKKHSNYKNSNINYNEVPFFREIPCNKNIFYANTLLYLNGINYEKGNIIGAILLKWVKEGKISFIKNNQEIFSEKNGNIRFYDNVKHDNILEEVLYKMMKIASKDDVLEAKEFKKYCKEQCVAFSELLDTFNQNIIKELLKNNIITNNSQISNDMYDMSDKAYEDSIQLFGLKRFLEEFSKIDTKEVLDVKLWDEYLMFAYLFGIADKVAEQFHKLYPADLQNFQFDYSIANFISDLIFESFKNMSSYETITKATDKFSNAVGSTIGNVIESAHDAESYSAGGGGRSSRGGGSGSIGGGGRGSMGGR